MIFLGFPTKKHIWDGFGVIFLGLPTEKHILVLDFPSGKHVKGRKEGKKEGRKKARKQRRRKEGRKEGGKEGRKEGGKKKGEKEGRKEGRKKARRQERKEGRKEERKERKQGSKEEKSLTCVVRYLRFLPGQRLFYHRARTACDCLWFSQEKPTILRAKSTSPCVFPGNKPFAVHFGLCFFCLV